MSIFIKSAVKATLYIVAIILALVVLGLGAIWLAFYPERVGWREYMNSCDVSGDVSVIDFVGHQLNIPTAYIDECRSMPFYEESSRELHPAFINLNLSLPDFKPLGGAAHDGKKAYEHSLQITLKSYGPEKTLTKEPTFSTTGRGRNHKDDEVLYERKEVLKNGLIHFQKTENAFVRNPNDVYVYQKDADHIFMVIECNRAHHYYECSAQEVTIRDHVLLQYHFSLKYLDDIKNIDKEIYRFVKQLWVKS
ncbi:MAG: hypothetical protein MRY32_03230 [Rickettsiales bacterium]|nr:hypothetical protein [Rickettsiales bacterium]